MLMIAFLLVVTLTTQTRAASLSAKDVQIIAKVLGFLDPPVGDGTVAVVYAPNDAASRADAMEIAATFGGGLKVGNSTVGAVAVDAASLGVSRHYVAIVMAAGAPTDQIMLIARTLHIPCITGDVAVVQAGRCIMGIHSEPRVDIVLNHDLAASIGISFATAFRMLVHEI